jgi:hypothetical protein
MKPAQRKTLIVTALSVAAIGFAGVVSWLFNALATLLKAVNLEALPESWVVAFSFFAMVVGGLTGLLNLFRGDDTPTEPAPEPDGG